MKGLKQLNLHIPISVLKAEIGSIKSYFHFSRSRASVIFFVYTCNHLNAILKCTSLWNSLSTPTKYAFAGNTSNEALSCQLTSPELNTLHLNMNLKSRKLNLSSIPFSEKEKRLLNGSNKLNVNLATETEVTIN